jgi:hypothetical protein
MYTRCPKCGHAPLPADQSLPAACGGCGVILAKIGQTVRHRPAATARGRSAATDEDVPPDVARDGLLHRLGAMVLYLPDRVDPLRWWLRVGLLAAFGVWGVVLIGADYRTGELGGSFIHRPLLVFHEAGHVVFMILGHWMMILGGTLGQLIMPLVLGGALLLKNRDNFGAALGLWLLGVSVLDVAPYVYDALEPQLMLLSGRTGEEGGHDWIFLLSSLGLLPRAQMLGALVHKAGALLVLLSLAWAAWIVRMQYPRLSHDTLHEE